LCEKGYQSEFTVKMSRCMMAMVMVYVYSLSMVHLDAFSYQKTVSLQNQVESSGGEYLDQSSSVLLALEDRVVLLDMSDYDSFKSLQAHLESSYNIPIEEQNIYLSAAEHRKLESLDCIPSGQPSSAPSAQPSAQPTGLPSAMPSNEPSACPSATPSWEPTGRPSSGPSGHPSSQPSGHPTGRPSNQPSSQPSGFTKCPSGRPTSEPTAEPTGEPSGEPSAPLSVGPTGVPSRMPSAQPTGCPSCQPSSLPSVTPSGVPSMTPTGGPASAPSGEPTGVPSGQPSTQPSVKPTDVPSGEPSSQPSGDPSSGPTSCPSAVPSVSPSSEPSGKPSCEPSGQPSAEPTSVPSAEPSGHPTSQPSGQPSTQPTTLPSAMPSVQPSSQPSGQPSAVPTSVPSAEPSGHPTSQPSGQPSTQPTTLPSAMPSVRPSSQPSGQPSTAPTVTSHPTSVPTRILEWLQLGADIDGAVGDKCGSGVALSRDGSVMAVGCPENDGSAVNAGMVRIYEYDGAGDAWIQKGSDIFGEGSGDKSGSALSVSSDGSRVAIGADKNDDGGANAGHVRVYEYSSGLSDWSQLGADLDGEAAIDTSGRSVSLSADGNKLAIGAIRNDVAGEDAGHVRVFEYSSGSGSWSQLGSAINGEAAGDQSGISVSLSSDGTVVAIGATGNGGAGVDAGHVRVFNYTSADASWSQLGADIDGDEPGDKSGLYVSLSDDGSRLAVSSHLNTSGTGSVRVFSYDTEGSTWTQMGSNIAGEAEGDMSGWSTSLSGNGERVAIGARVNSDNGASAGHVRVFEYGVGDTWEQIGSDLDGEAAGDLSGIAVSLSQDGQRVAIGGPQNAGNGTDAGHVRVFQLPFHPSSQPSGQPSEQPTSQPTPVTRRLVAGSQAWTSSEDPGTEAKDFEESQLAYFYLDGEMLQFDMSGEDSLSALQTYLYKAYDVPPVEQILFLSTGGSRRLLPAVECVPTGQPSSEPSSFPSLCPTSQPSTMTALPSASPSSRPSFIPTSQPSRLPTATPSVSPSGQPSLQPSAEPTSLPSSLPSGRPSLLPTGEPTYQPSSQPSSEPSGVPSVVPSRPPSMLTVSTSVEFNCSTSVDVSPEYFDSAAREAWINVTAGAAKMPQENIQILSVVSNSNESSTRRRRLDSDSSIILMSIRDAIESYGVNDPDLFATLIQDRISDAYADPSTVLRFLHVAVSKGTQNFTTNTSMDISDISYSPIVITAVLTGTPSLTPTVGSTLASKENSIISSAIANEESIFVTAAILVVFFIGVFCCYRFSKNKANMMKSTELSWEYSTRDEETGWYSSSSDESGEEYDDNSYDDYEHDSADYDGDYDGEEKNEEEKDGYIQRYDSPLMARRPEASFKHHMEQDEPAEQSKKDLPEMNSDIFAAGPSPSSAETSDWVERFSETKKLPYWKNSKTKQTTWKNPFDKSKGVLTRSQSDNYAPSTSSQVESSATPASSDWEERFSKTKQLPYWKNTKTQQTTWRNPFFKSKDTMKRSQSYSPAKVGGLKSIDEFDEDAAASLNRDQSSVWVERFSETKKKPYWKNTLTNKSTWKNPFPEKQPEGVGTTIPETPMSTSFPETPTNTFESIMPTTSVSVNASHPDEWEERMSRTKQRPYWKHKTTGETTWILPEKATSEQKSYPDK